MAIAVTGNPKVMPRTIIGGGLPKVGTVASLPLSAPSIPLPVALPVTEPGPVATLGPQPVVLPAYAPDIPQYAPSQGQPGVNIVLPARDVTSPTATATSLAIAKARREASLLAARDSAPMNPIIDGATPDIRDVPIVVQPPTEVLYMADGALTRASASPSVQAAALRQSGGAGTDGTLEQQALTAPTADQQAAGISDTGPATPAAAAGLAGAGTSTVLLVLAIIGAVMLSRRPRR